LGDREGEDYDIVFGAEYRDLDEEAEKHRIGR
jgi:hypothetical protein